MKNASEGAFQLYTVVQDGIACLVPKDMAYETAAVLPRGSVNCGMCVFSEGLSGVGVPRGAGQAEGLGAAGLGKRE